MSKLIKVLVASSDVALREAATSILLREGCVVDQAGDWTSAIGACEGRRPPDVLFLDVRRPSDDLRVLLDELEHVLGGGSVVLLASSATPPRLRRHPAVVHVVEAGEPIRTLLSFTRWLAAA